MIALLAKHARMKCGIRQYANPENHVSRLTVRIDVIISQRKLNAELRILLRQAR